MVLSSYQTSCPETLWNLPIRSALEFIIVYSLYSLLEVIIISANTRNTAAQYNRWIDAKQDFFERKVKIYAPQTTSMHKGILLVRSWSLTRSCLHNNSSCCAQGRMGYPIREKGYLEITSDGMVTTFRLFEAILTYY